MIRRFASLMVALFFSIAGGWAQGNPFEGTWELVPSKSTFGDIRRISQTVTLEVRGEELRSHSKIVYEGGRTAETRWSARFDGEGSVLEGDPHYNIVAVKMIDERTLEITSKREASVGRISRWFISPDGKTLTKIQTVINPQGITVHNLIVLQKQ